MTTGTAKYASMDDSYIKVQIYDDDVATGWYILNTAADDFEPGQLV